MSYREVIDWLLEGDPAIIYQVHRDLLESPKEELEMLQMYMEIKDGWVNNLLEVQDGYGSWMKDIVVPRWNGTIWVLTLLRRMDIATTIMKAQLGGRIIFENGQRLDGGYNYDLERNESKVCISAAILANLSFLKIKDPKREAIFEYLIESQMDDGGWSCSRLQGAEKSNFSTTFIVLEALNLYKKVQKANLSTIEIMEEKARELLLSHRLYQNEFGTPIKDTYVKFTFPSRLNYNILDVLDYFQSINYRYDERLGPAINLLRKKKNEAGKWNLELIVEGEKWQDYEPIGESKWVTVKALRVLRWWNKVSKFKY